MVHKAGAQDTVSLGGVEVSVRKLELSQIGKKTEVMDSTAKEQFKYASVADLLAYNSSVFIKSYGPGQLATTAFRGSNASQTAVLWNGFNLQNAMLGQADLALMPSILFEDISVEYGGSSSLWGSGAIGGSIHLNSSAAFRQGLRTAINISGGSFGTMNTSAAVLVSKKRFLSSTKVYLNSSRNDFKYKDTADKENNDKRQRDAEYSFKGLMQEFKYMINARQIISVSGWLNTNTRHLPNYNANYNSKTYQKDDAVRVSANWTYVQKQYRSVVRAGYFIDKINYDDSISKLYSKSKAKTLMVENEHYFTLGKISLLNVAATFLSSSATSDDYSSERSISRASLLAGNKWTLLHGKLLGYASVRAEYFSVGTLPVTGNISLEYRLTKKITTKLNAAKVYRQPTLNELYWVPGGNVHLKPEQGWTYEGEINYGRQFRRVHFFVSGSAYSRMIDNWILWVPGANGNPSPMNIQKVWSRGTETSWKLHYQYHKFRLGTTFITAYVLSTVEANAQQNTGSENKQLIYTPRYTVNGSVFAGYGNVDLAFYHQYCGYRFTTSDNASWLNPYHVSSLRLNYKMVFKDMGLTFFAACNNLFNSDYQVLAGRPTALRNYEAGISFKSQPRHQNK